MDQAMDGMDQTDQGDTGDTGDTGSDTGIVIEIKCSSDGTFSVSSEPISEENQEEQGEPDENAQTVDSFGDALKAALVLYRENSPSDSTAQQQFASGFKKGGK